MNVYKISDIIKYEFLKIPKVMFANEAYRRLSSDAKLTYSLLYDRLSLSKLNGWINENDEVYLIYTREEVAYDLGISYKKAITAFKELTSIGLIFEKRCGRGMPNKIFIVKPELDEECSKKQVKNENLRTADSVCLEGKRLEITAEDELNGSSETVNVDVEICKNSISRPAETEVEDMPKRHTNNTDNNKTNINNSYISQSVKVFYVDNEETIIAYRQKETIYDFDEILESCQLETFDEEERKLLYDALERMYYSETFNVGKAVLPQDKVRSRMYEIDVNVLRSAIDKIHKNDKPIKNITSYIMSVIFNCITEEYSFLHVDPYLNYLRAKRKE